MVHKSTLYCFHKTSLIFISTDPLSKARAILNCPTPTTTTPSMNSSHLWWRSSTTTKTTRATPHQQIGAMSSAKTITNSDVNNNHAERKGISDIKNRANAEH